MYSFCSCYNSRKPSEAQDSPGFFILWKAQWRFWPLLLPGAKSVLAPLPCLPRIFRQNFNKIYICYQIWIENITKKNKIIKLDVFAIIFKQMSLSWAGAPSFPPKTAFAKAKVTAKKKQLKRPGIYLLVLVARSSHNQAHCEAQQTMTSLLPEIPLEGGRLYDLQPLTILTMGFSLIIRLAPDQNHIHHHYW